VAPDEASTACDENTTRHHHSFCEQTGSVAFPVSLTRPWRNSGWNQAFRHSRLMKKMFGRAVHTTEPSGPDDLPAVTHETDTHCPRSSHESTMHKHSAGRGSCCPSRPSPQSRAHARVCLGRQAHHRRHSALSGRERAVLAVAHYQPRSLQWSSSGLQGEKASLFAVEGGASGNLRYPRSLLPPGFLPS
jgi:hypothetical protein